MEPHEFLTIIETIKREVKEITLRMNDLTLSNSEIDKLMRRYWELWYEYNEHHRINNIPNICSLNGFEYDRNKYPLIACDGRPYRFEDVPSKSDVRIWDVAVVVYFNPNEQES